MQRGSYMNLLNDIKLMKSPFKTARDQLKNGDIYFCGDSIKGFVRWHTVRLIWGPCTCVENCFRTLSRPLRTGISGRSATKTQGPGTNRHGRQQSYSPSTIPLVDYTSHCCTYIKTNIKRIWNGGSGFRKRVTVL